MLYRIETCKTVNNVEVCFSLGYASNSVDAGYLANLACVGFFFISLVQIISTLLGDKTPIQVRIFHDNHWRQSALNIVQVHYRAGTGNFGEFSPHIIL